MSWDTVAALWADTKTLATSPGRLRRPTSRRGGPAAPGEIMKNLEKSQKNRENHEIWNIFHFQQKPSGVRLGPPGHAYGRGKDS